MSDLKSELIKSGAVPDDSEFVADIIVRYIQSFDTEIPESTLEAIIGSRQPGRHDAEYCCVNPRNLVVNWKDLMTQGVPATIGAGGAFVAHPVLGAVAALGALRVLYGNAKVEFGEKEGRVIEALWITLADKNPVGVADVETVLSDAMTGKALEEILDVLEELRIIEVEDGVNITKRDRLILK